MYWLLVPTNQKAKNAAYCTWGLGEISVNYLPDVSIDVFDTCVLIHDFFALYIEFV